MEYVEMTHFFGIGRSKIFYTGENLAENIAESIPLKGKWS